MPYTNAWNEATPTSATVANTIAQYWTNNMKAVRERIDDIFGTSGANSVNTADPYKPFILKLSGQADSYIIGGSSSSGFKENTGTTWNFRIFNTGNIYHNAEKFIPGKTTYAFRDTTDGYDNVIFLDNGNVTVRGTISAPNIAIDTLARISGGQGIIDEYDNGNSGATKTIDWNNGNNQKLTLTAACVLTFTNPIAAGFYFLRIVQGGSGSYTITWPTTKWASAVAPTLTTTVGKQDFISFYYDGTSYNGFISGYNY